MGTLPDPNRLSASHPTEEILEEYVFHRLPEPLVAQVEEHLLICPRCQDAVMGTDRFVSDLKVAGRLPVPAIGQVRSAWRAGTNLAPALALAVLALVVVWKRPTEPSPPVAVSLSSLRAADPLAPAPAGKPLLLNIEAPDLSRGTDYRVEVVDVAGSPVWKGTVSDIGGKRATAMSKPLKNGVYWVRLYGANSELLREFGLSAK